MESLTPRITSLKNLRQKTRELISAASSLAPLLEEEASRLNREEEISRLITLRFSIKQQLDEVKSNENTARYDHNREKLVTSLSGLILGSAIKMTSKDKQLLGAWVTTRLSGN